MMHFHVRSTEPRDLGVDAQAALPAGGHLPKWQLPDGGGGGDWNGDQTLNKRISWKAALALIIHVTF